MTLSADMASVSAQLSAYADTLNAAMADQVTQSSAASIAGNVDTVIKAIDAGATTPSVRAYLGKMKSSVQAAATGAASRNRANSAALQAAMQAVTKSISRMVATATAEGRAAVAAAAKQRADDQKIVDTVTKDANAKLAESNRLLKIYAQRTGDAEKRAASVTAQAASEPRVARATLANLTDEAGYLARHIGAIERGKEKLPAIQLAAERVKAPRLSGDVQNMPLAPWIAAGIGLMLAGPIGAAGGYAAVEVITKKNKGVTP